MFSPVTPILPTDAPDDAVGAVLTRVEAIRIVLAALARMAGRSAAPDLHALSRHADLSAALADMDRQHTAHIMRELDAIAAALQAGFVAVEKARARGHAALAATGFLYAECRDAFASTLAAATAHRASP